MATKVPKATRDELNQVLTLAISRADMTDKWVNSIDGELFVLKLSFYVSASIVLGCGLTYALLGT